MAIRTKLAVWYSLLVAAVLVITGTVRFVGTERLLVERKDYALKVVADILDSSIPKSQPDRATIQKSVSRMISSYPDIELKGILMEVYESEGRLVYSSSLSEKERLPLTSAAKQGPRPRSVSIVTTETSGGERVRLLTKPVFSRDRELMVIQVGNSMRDVDETLRDFVIVNLVFIPIAVLTIGLGGWYLTRRALAPLRQVIRTARQISSGSLRHRIESPQAAEELRELQTAFNEMIDRLERSFDQMKEFSDNVSHELRIPLSILRGQTEVSLRRVRSEEAYRGVLESNLEEISRMEKIVERLLFLSRADRGEVPLSLGPVDLSALARQLFDFFRISAEEKSVRLILEGEEAAPVIGDDVLLRELAANLIQNALTATPPGGEVRLGAWSDGESARFCVSDNGIGIPQEALDRIFERFYMVDQSRTGHGVGLGLSLCRWIAKAHQGRITVESEVGAGSRFTLHLRIARLEISNPQLIVS